MCAKVSKFVALVCCWRNSKRAGSDRQQRKRRLDSPPSKSAEAKYGCDRTISAAKVKSFWTMYSVYGVIGIGGGGMVYSGHRICDNQPIAIKRIAKSKVKRWEWLKDRRVPQEIVLMMSVSRHRGVIRLLDWYESAESFILILERPENSIDLFDYIRECGCVPERDAKVVFRQVVAAIHHVHACGVVHRDIKDENVVINRDNGECKIIDFGCGTFLKTRPYTDFSGTPEFYPPEWFNQRCYGGRTSAVWSLGILLFDMLCGEIPFKTKSQICSGIFEFKGPVSREAKHLIRWMLSFDPANRPLFTQILCHPWLKGISLSRSLN